MKYTYDDIITAKDILTGKVKKEDIIGKKGWFFNYLPIDLNPNTLYRIDNPRLLFAINVKATFPFISSTRFYYFLPEKEESAPVKSCEEHKLPDEIHELDISVFSSLETIWEIDRPLCPRIKGYTINDSGEIVAFDNTAGEFFVEDFDTREKAISWLRGTGTKEEAEAKDKPEYIPYDLSDAEYRALLRGDWVVSKKTGSEGQIIGFHQIASGEWTADIGWGINATADGLLDGFIFSDGSPVGICLSSKWPANEISTCIARDWPEIRG